MKGRALAMPNEAQRVDLAAVANRERMNEIIKAGVHEIGLNATLDELEQGMAAADTWGGKAKGQLLELLQTFLTKDPDVGDLLGRDLSNMNAKLALSFRKNAAGFVDQEAFDNAAEHVIDEGEPGIYIKLRSGTIINDEKIKLSKFADIDNFGNTIDHQQAWAELEAYYAELINDRFLVE
jgi:hypothetical protein